jgi:hypothetical protein
MHGDVAVVVVGLVVALAFSTLIKAFTDFVINPLIDAAQGGGSIGLGVQLGQAGKRPTFIDFDSFISRATTASVALRGLQPGGPRPGPMLVGPCRRGTPSRGDQ